MAKLYETITAENWFKGDGTPGVWPEGRLCLGLSMQALYPGTHMTIALKIDEAIAALFPDRLNRFQCVDIVHFNDHPDTTLDDVLRVCKLADV